MNIWPYPNEINVGEKFFEIEPTSFSLRYKHDKCHLLSDIVMRYRKILFVQSCNLLDMTNRQNFFNTKHNYNLNPKFAGMMWSLNITIDGECEEWPHLNMDESYQIVINEKTRELRSKSIWGVMRGLETFSQMAQHVGRDQFIVQISNVTDAPRFSHRGLLIDTSRHFMSVKSIFETLDAMYYNKLNVLHWHIVDDQSFPYVSENFPELSKKGAYNPITHIYDQATVKRIIEYARVRGIRVIPEFDSPGHTQSWGKGQPGLLAECYGKNGPTGTYGPIDPTKESSYEFLEKFFFEIVHDFPDNYTHLGGDEVSFICWASNPQIASFMKQKKIQTVEKLEEYYIQKLIDIVDGMNKSYVVWQEVFDNGVEINNETLVHVWKSGWETEMSKVTSKGYKSLLSSCWYLDMISYGSDWVNYYNCDPHAFNGTEEQKNLVLGGEACIWAELVDSSNLVSRTW